LTTELVCLAPAKLNLFLHVVGRREDGYHLLQTVFRFVDFSDRLHFSMREDGVVKLYTPTPGVPEDQDLCVRAAKLLQQESGISRGVEIFLEKGWGVVVPMRLPHCWRLTGYGDWAGKGIGY
jgi:4-diphosphocytidyl-2-C-methyl-D-erythritol kinase